MVWLILTLPIVWSTSIHLRLFIHTYTKHVCKYINHVITKLIYMHTIYTYIWNEKKRTRIFLNPKLWKYIHAFSPNKPTMLTTRSRDHLFTCVNVTWGVIEVLLWSGRQLGILILFFLLLFSPFLHLWLHIFFNENYRFVKFNIMESLFWNKHLNFNKISHKKQKIIH